MSLKAQLALPGADCPFHLVLADLADHRDRQIRVHGPIVGRGLHLGGKTGRGRKFYASVVGNNRNIADRRRSLCVQYLDAAVMGFQLCVSAAKVEPAGKGADNCTVRSYLAYMAQLPMLMQPASSVNKHNKQPSESFAM